jgi:hypothetical protein
MVHSSLIDRLALNRPATSASRPPARGPESLALVLVLAVLQAACAAPPRHDARATPIDDVASALYSPPTQCTHYIAPSGADGDASNGCTDSNAPCRTWDKVLPLLTPGKTLCVEPGSPGETYTTPVNHAFFADCSGPASPYHSGTAFNHITVRAWKSAYDSGERASVIQADVDPGHPSLGISGVRINQCKYWDLWGLSVVGKDVPVPSKTRSSSEPAITNNANGGLVAILNTSAVTVRRFHIQNSNRCLNDRMLWVYGSSDVLIEENELYNVSDHGINGEVSSQLTMRRNYVNANYFPVPTADACNCSTDANSPDKQVCPWSGCSTNYSSCGWAQAILLYYASGSVVENNVAEYAGYGFSIMHQLAGSTSSGSHNKLMGNLALDDYMGVTLSNRGDGYGGDSGMRDITIANQLSLSSPHAPNPITRHLWIPGASVAQLSLADSSFINTNGNSPTVAWIEHGPGAVNTLEDSISIRDTLMMTNAAATAPVLAFTAAPWSECDVSNARLFNTGQLPASCATGLVQTGNPNVAPVGANQCSTGSTGCLAYTACNPTLSGAAGATSAGPIGANLIYRYENATVRPARSENGAVVPNWLWAPEAVDGIGAFPCGRDVTTALDTFQGVPLTKQRSCRTFPKLDLAIHSAQCPAPSSF